MKKTLQYIVAVLMLVSVTGVRAGNLDPTNGPAPTMHTLEEIYQKLLELQNEVDQLKAPELNLVQPEFVTVGDPGNRPDNYLFGAVSYEYRIGKYEVTNAEYVQFLNAVDPTGANGLALYNTNMNTDARSGISNNVSAVNGAKYAAKPDRENKPVVFVSFYDAMRFCNWLHNGAVVGGDTENGAYTLLPPLDPTTKAPSNGTTVERNAGAKFAVPIEDEWHKAGYYDPENLEAGANSSTNYWVYPTMSDTAPTASGPTNAVNHANYDNAAGNVTDVGAYTGSPSYYGTFDQGGNVWEWTETITGTARFIRGGSYSSPDKKSLEDLQGRNSYTLGNELNFLGFRISSP